MAIVYIYASSSLKWKEREFQMYVHVIPYVRLYYHIILLLGYIVNKRV